MLQEKVVTMALLCVNDKIAQQEKKNGWGSYL